MFLSSVCVSNVYLMLITLILSIIKKRIIKLTYRSFGKAAKQAQKVTNWLEIILIMLLTGIYVLCIIFIKAFIKLQTVVFFKVKKFYKSDLKIASSKFRKSTIKRSKTRKKNCFKKYEMLLKLELK